MKPMTEEIMKRIEVQKKKQEKIKTSLLGGLTTGMVFLLTVVIHVFSGESAAEAGYSVMGAFLLGPETGGYILVAVLAFLIGILVTLLTQRYRNSGMPKKDIWKQK